MKVKYNFGSKFSTFKAYKIFVAARSLLRSAFGCSYLSKIHGITVKIAGIFHFYIQIQLVALNTEKLPYSNSDRL